MNSREISQITMVAVYGSCQGEVPVVARESRNKAARALTAVSILALCTVAVVVLSSSAVQRTELYDPANVHNVQGIWHSPDEAWQGIDTVLPTQATAWEDPSAASVGYEFKGPGSVTSPFGHTGYYDTALHNGRYEEDGSEQEVLPDTVNGAMGYDSTLSGTNTFWGSRGGDNVDEPAAWSNQEPMTVEEMSAGGIPNKW
mmetsp:Transcript_51366/g.121743  ORF Transcript_51366/g.121743 Transcript_51366/m.121743 type:complete len:200 (+) Transcript_51366:1-600(+)